jgi:hypothetical protein
VAERGERPGLPQSPDEVADRLAWIGPIIGAQQRAEAELDRETVDRMRADLAARLHGGATPVRRRLSPYLPGIAGALALACVILAVVLLRPQPRHATLINVPRLSTAELLLSSPSYSAGATSSPTRSPAHLPVLHPFRGRLQFLSPHLPHPPTTMPAYRLGTIAGWRAFPKRLQIRSRFHMVRAAGSTWMVAADHEPLHSLAVSRDTGEVIYRDRRNFVLPHSARALGRARAISAARRWLQARGWPGDEMPVRSAATLPRNHKIRDISLGWVGGGRAAVAEATLWVTPDGSVVEALVWPPIERQGVVPARSPAAAWSDVRRGLVPVEVPSLSPLSRARGIARLLAAHAVSLLARARDGHMYLVPAYRFQGTARVGVSPAVQRWMSMAPAAKR